jgi:hypothetical protein
MWEILNFFVYILWGTNIPFDNKSKMLNHTAYVFSIKYLNRRTIDKNIKKRPLKKNDRLKR